MNHLRSILIVTLVVGISHPMSKSAEPSAGADRASIPYASLDEAIAALKSKKGVTFRNQDGWVVAEDRENMTVWLLTPPGHPAYPSMVKRVLVTEADGTYFETNVRCLASKVTCDRFFGGK
jgi:hypothetical protein